ncbi:uncharacterized protein DUF4232 [Streptomyces sp. Ag109_O5-1]|uniref:DUF4232 domain-containing protein n=1 Tax=Streptomyces sp. Ag109_O5-1 TaxID=1938851 RepID=UPI000F50E4CD|nr:DUF4232 domain-containing protein [Streptomyces sp. Ag109_O5-1]RPE42329.1 uncharacterized protein DUF4232 [Streptomyces sp. Ag109_O5-1]
MSNLRNRRKTAAALTGAAALMALLTACNGTATGSVKTDNGAAAPAAGNSTSGSGSSGTGTTSNGGTSGGGNTSGSSTSGGSASGGSSSGGSSSGGSAAGTSVPSCQASQLGYSWADPGSGTGQQKHAVVAFTNKSGHSCTMYGFPGVDLVNSGQKWSLQRTNATPKRVTLANGASTNFAITFLVPAQGDSTTFTPTTVVVTAPNQRTSFDLSWHGGAVLLQDGATHPGTFIGPVGE